MNVVVLKLDYGDEGCKEKVMKTVLRHPQVESIALDTRDKKLTVTGNIDKDSLMTKLKDLCRTKIVSEGTARVRRAEVKKEEAVKVTREPVKKEEAAKKKEVKREPVKKEEAAKKKEVKREPVKKEEAAKKKEVKREPVKKEKAKKY